MWSYPTHNRKFQKNSKKIQKFRKCHHSFVSSQNRQGKATKERKGNKSFRCVSSRPVTEHSIKIAKKLKKFENTILAFLEAKRGQESPRKRANKKNRSVVFLPDPQQKVPKKQQKNSKIQKIPSQLRFKPKQDGKGYEREKRQKIVPLCFFPSCN